MQSVISKYLSKKYGKFYVALDDFKNALDSVRRGKMWNILRKNGIKGKRSKAIQGMYECVKSRVRFNSTLTDRFDCPVGLKQGCFASPFCFLYSLTNWQNKINIPNIEAIS